jgi:DNA-binding SARP family transcriptional activator
MDPNRVSRLPSYAGTNRQKSLTTGQGAPVPGTNSPRLFLYIRFFGRFEMSFGNEVLPLPRSPKVTAILKYLLASPERPTSRDFLMAWLWPESDFTRAKYSVNSAIYVLRKHLSGLFSTLTPTECILLEHDHYRLSPNIHVQSDKDKFDARYRHGSELERAQQVSEAVAEYSEAIALYEGEFLSEDLYEEWTLIERQRLGAAYVDMLERIAAYHKVNGNYRESIEACYRILAKEPCQESSHRLLMECYARLGLRTQALRQYELCEEILTSYGIVPTGEIKKIYEQI